jgi:hypothetical protein
MENEQIPDGVEVLDDTNPESNGQELNNVQEAQPTDNLFELPDGRKVDSQTLYKEYAENLLPEFTRRSQELASLKKEINKETQQKDWQKEDWVPNSYADLVSLARQEALEAIKAEQNQLSQQRESLSQAVRGQLDELKKSDKDLNENALLSHAAKYKFTDLSVAYSNYKEMKAVQEIAKKEALTPKANPVATGGVKKESSGSIDYNSIQQNLSPLEMLRKFKV